MLKWIYKNRTALLIGLIPSIICGIVFWYIGLQKVDIKYKVNTFTIGSSSIINTTLKEVLENRELSATNVTIINKGNVALNGTSMLKKAPLTVQVDKKYKLIDVYKYEKETTSSLDYSLNIEQNKVIILFDVLNPNDKITLTVLHTGVTDKDIFVSGKWENYTGIKKIDDEKTDLYNLLFLTILVCSLVSSITMKKLLRREYDKEFEYIYGHIFKRANGEN